MKFPDISFDELKQYYEDLSDNYSILQEKFGDEMKRNNELNTKLFQAVSQYNAVVQQNKDLQTELNQKNKMIDELNSKPFFPYQMNDGGRLDFGSFVLISHAWFSFLNTKFQVGIVEVEYKNDNRRVMYVGITNPVATERGFRDSVIEIAAYGQKIKDSAEG